MAGPGGRKRGSRNKAVIERERIAAEIAARTVADAKISGKKLAKEVLDDFMHLFAGMAAHHQPIPKGQPIPPGRDPDRAMFEKYAQMAVSCAADLAKYQSPTFKAVQIVDQPQVVERPSAQVIDLATDVSALQARYQRMIKAGT